MWIIEYNYNRYIGAIKQYIAQQQQTEYWEQRPWDEFWHVPVCRVFVGEKWRRNM